MLSYICPGPRCIACTRFSEPGHFCDHARCISGRGPIPAGSTWVERVSIRSTGEAGPWSIRSEQAPNPTEHPTLSGHRRWLEPWAGLRHGGESQMPALGREEQRRARRDLAPDRPDLGIKGAAQRPVRKVAGDDPLGSATRSAPSDQRVRVRDGHAGLVAVDPLRVAPPHCSGPVAGVRRSRVRCRGKDAHSSTYRDGWLPGGRGCPPCPRLTRNRNASLGETSHRKERP